MAKKTMTRPCSNAEARQRCDRAREFLEVADIVKDENDPQDHAMLYASAAGSLAVLAGIAACDAACCHALGERSRGQDHRQATKLVEQITPGGKQAAKSLSELLNHKDKAQYGFLALGGAELKKVIRSSEKLIEFADQVLRR